MQREFIAALRYGLLEQAAESAQIGASLDDFLNGLPVLQGRHGDARAGQFGEA